MNKFVSAGNALETDPVESPELFILHCIHDNELDHLKKINIKEYNINFLYEYKDISFDKKITPLILACYLGRIECAKMLLENSNVDVDLASEDSRYTPLSVSCLTGNYEIVKLLLDMKAEVNLPNKFNQTPFVLCFSRLNEETNTYENTKICFKMIELLLDAGADINWIVDKNKCHTVLMQFCSVKIELEEKQKRINLEVIRFLIEHGADKYMLSHKGKGCAELAKKHKNGEEVAEILKNTIQIHHHAKNKKAPPINVNYIKQRSLSRDFSSLSASKKK